MSYKNILDDGYIEYRDKCGRLHRKNGPAIFDSVAPEFSPFYQWWHHGKIHRVGGPAIQDGNRLYWKQNNKLHREDGPAKIIGGEHKEWYINGKRHRIDGPAVIRLSGTEEFWVNDVRVTKEQFKDKKALTFLLLSC